jgi:HK97 family phage portal protein
MSRYDLVETSVQHLKLTGEAYWVIAYDPRAPSIPLELWPVRPDRMLPVPHPTEFLTGWMYQSPDGLQIPLELAEVIQIKLPNPMDPYRGMGPVQALLADLDSIRYSAEWNRRFFLNDASPGGIVELDDSLPDSEFNRMRDRWYEQHRGVGNANRVAFLERAHWKDRQFTMRDMQFVELRTISRDIIREAFRIHKSILGLSDDVNRANAVAADHQFGEWVLNPTLDRLKGALNTKLMPLYGTPVTRVFDHESAASEDEDAENAALVARTGAFKTLIDAGVHPVDAAAVCELPPMRKAVAAPAPVPVTTGDGAVMKRINVAALATGTGTRRTSRPVNRAHTGQREWFKIENSGQDSASVSIFDEVGYWGVTASDFADQLQALDVAYLDVRINSPGGEVFDGITIYNALLDHKAEVTTHVDGLAASIASVIAQAGTMRICAKASQMMIHSPFALCMGDSSDMRQAADMLDKTAGMIAGVYSDRAGGSPEMWMAAMRAETWYTAEEAKAAGLCDMVRGTATASDSAWDLSTFKHGGRAAAPAPPALVWDPAAFTRAVKEGVSR